MFWELLTNFLINSISAFFTFLVLMKMTITLKPDFGFWLVGKLEEKAEQIKEKSEMSNKK